MPNEERRDSLGPLITQAVHSRRLQGWALIASKWLVGFVAGGGLLTGGLKVVTWVTTRDGIVEQNARLNELEGAVGLPRLAPEKQAEASLRARVTALETVEKARALQASDQQSIYERQVSILCASVEPRAPKRAMAARACVEEYRSLIDGGMTPRSAADKVLESTIPRSTYAP